MEWVVSAARSVALESGADLQGYAIVCSFNRRRTKFSDKRGDAAESNSTNQWSPWSGSRA